VLFVRQITEVQREIERRFSGHLRRIGPALAAFPKSDLVRKALNSMASLSLHDVPLDQALESIAKTHGLEIEIKTRALTDSGIATSTPMTCELENQRLGDALGILMWPLHLRYYVDGEVIFVTSSTEASRTLSAIEYDASDAVRLFGDLKSVISAIESLVQPTAWNRVGGPGQIVALPDGRKLSIDQSYSVHADLHEFFALIQAAVSDGGNSAN
jgi:hypothetical protein